MLFALSQSVTGCGMTFQMPSLMGSSEDVQTTGSLTSTKIEESEIFSSANFDEEDQRRAQNALGLALDPQGSGAVVQWENPDSGKKGSFVPLANPYVEGDDICRAFSSEIAQGSTMNVYQGIACRLSGEDWKIKSFSLSKKGAQKTKENSDKKLKPLPNSNEDSL